MNTKIKILCIILSLIYVGAIVKSIIPSIESSQAGYHLGRETGKKDTDYEILHFSVVPKEHLYSFPTTVKNEKTGKEVEAEVTGYKVKIENPSLFTTSGSAILFFIKGIFAFISLVLIIYLPILFFKVIKRSTKGDIIESGVIKKIRRIGWIFIISFAIETSSYLFDFLEVRNLIKLESYQISMMPSNYYILIIGVILLLLAEVLKESLRMKEEQELTI